MKITKPREKLYRWLLLLILYLPFQIALNPKNEYDLASVRVLIILFFIITFILIWQSKSANLADFLTRPSWLLFFFLLWGLISLSGAPNPFWGLRKIIYFASIFPLYLIVIALVKNQKQIVKLIKFLLAGLSGLTLIGLLQFSSQFIFGLERVYQFWAINILPVFSGFKLGGMILNYPSWLVNLNGQTLMRAFSLFSDPHMFSFCLGLAIPLSVAGFLTCRNKPFFAVFYLLFNAGLILSFARGAYLALIITLIVMAWLIWRWLGNKIIPLLLLATTLVFWLPISPAADRFYSSFNPTEGSNAGRLAMWQQAGEIGVNHFWLGIGLGNYSLSLDEFDYRNPATAHNFYLDLFSETGLLGLLLWLLLILSVLWRLFKKVNSTASYEQKIIGIGLIGSLIYFASHSLFETAVYQPTILSVLMIILGLSTLLSQKTNCRPQTY